MLTNIEIEQAVEMMCALHVTHETEKVKLSEAQGRVLAAEIRAAIPSPPFDRSPYDGYAFRGEDTTNATRECPAVLKITEEIPAGKAYEVEIMPGHAAKILTGAPIPKGANATIKYENTEFTEAEVRIFKPVAPDTDVIYAGDDIKEGALVADKGTVLTAPFLGVLAAQGLSEITVFRKPVVQILNTGTELLEVGTPLRPAMIYNSNVYTLSGYLRNEGVEPRNAGVVEDDPEEIAARISNALQVSDMVITTGGASVGDYDWAVTSASMLGADVLFWKVNMKPGGSLMAAVKDGKLILGLSGNPGAAVLGLLRIALPYIRKLCGRTDLYPACIDVILKEPLKKPSPKRRILRGRLEYIGGKAYFAENEGQGNGAVYSLLGCDLLGEIEAKSPPLPEGTLIKAYRI